MEEKFIRNIFYYKSYYLDFFTTLKPEVQRKFKWILKLIATINRVFSFFDKGQLVVLVNGFQKKSQKTPKNEISLSEKLKKQYFDEKESK